jgi:LacI family transcriptional regulator
VTSMKDVAKAAGVSLGTVSNVLNGRNIVQEETRIKVMKAVKELNYVPNSVARALKTNRTQIIGMILPTITNSFYAMIARVATDLAQNLGYTLLVSNTDRNPSLELESVKALFEKGVDGVIWVAKTLNSTKPFFETDRCTPILCVDSDWDETEVDQISVDNFQGGVMAAEHLYNFGHREIAVIEGPKEARKAWNRIHGFYYQLKQNGIKVPRELIRFGTFEYQSGYDAMVSLIKAGHHFTAVFAANDMMAISAIKAAREFGIKVPEDLSIVGFDDIILAQYFDPALSTIRQPAEKLGRLSVKMLVERIQEPDLPYRYQVLATELISRSSSRMIGR